MKIKVTNLGPLRQAEFELGDLTIICGENNTGKTYATYALYGFLRFWREAFAVPVPDPVVKELLEKGLASIPIEEWLQKASGIVGQACQEYTKRIPWVFASSQDRFINTTFDVELAEGEIRHPGPLEVSFGAEKNPRILVVRSESNKPALDVSLLVQEGTPGIPEKDLKRWIGIGLGQLIFARVFRNAFIISAERTGAAIFQRELDFARNRLLEEIGSGAKDLDPSELLNKVYSGYPLPVRRNVDFTRGLPDVAKNESFIAREHQDLLGAFNDVIGGEHRVKGNQLYFTPKRTGGLRLTMSESSSCVRALLDVGFYLRHSIQHGDLLVVDEPELSLHPKNQRRIARLFARLVNLGIKVFVTTHSDYIVKELNTLIMLNRDDPHIAEIREKEGYRPGELISADRVKVYIAGKSLLKLNGKRRSKVCTLTPADVDPELGIEAKSFDDTINDMNRIQQDILFGGE
ncbi:MAG: ATP-binding protein [Candidatus Coatesbacteria bacterium]|nr:ATP-binding protein [Candidatus Coatesbacteria bacterium]